MKNQKAITLIALIITIIVLLILAGVSISIVVGDDGIISQATGAVSSTELTSAIEEVALAWATTSGDYIKAWSTNRSTTKTEIFTLENLNDNLVGDGEITEFDYVEDGTSTVTYEKNGETYKLEIDDEGTVKLAGTGETVTPEEGGDTTEGEGDTTAISHHTTIPEGATYYVGLSSDNLTGNYEGATATYTEGDAFPEVTTGDVYVYGDYEYRYNKYCTATEVWTTGLNGWGVRAVDTTKSSYEEIITSINGKDITAMGCTFKECSNLVTSPTIPSTVEILNFTFAGCTMLTTYPMLSENATSIQGIFNGCVSLGETPEGFTIPDGVTNMAAAFYKCISLNGTIIIDANPTAYGECLYLDENGKDITLAGESTMLETLASTSTSGYRKVYDIDGNILQQ